MCQFCNGDINKFVSLLRKGVYPYKYMDNGERFDETPLPDRKYFYSELIVFKRLLMKIIQMFKSVWRIKTKKSWWLPWFVFSNGTLLLSQVFQNIRNKCIEIYELNLAHFFSAPGLACKRHASSKLV